MSSPACADSEGYDTPRQQREDTTIFMVAKDSYEACHGNHIEMPQSAAAGVARLGALRLTHRTWKHWPGGSTFPSLPVPHASNLAWHLTSESNSPHAGCTLLHGWGSAASFVIASLSKKKKKTCLHLVTCWPVTPAWYMKAGVSSSFKKHHRLHHKSAPIVQMHQAVR